MINFHSVHKLELGCIGVCWYMLHEGGVVLVHIT